MSCFNNDEFDDLLSDTERHILKLRKMLLQVVNSKNVIFQFDKHQQSDNLTIFSFLDSMGVNKEDFIKEYIMNVQPYMIHENVERSNKSSKFSCIIDPSYKLPLWIEVYYNQFSEQVVSFHEVNWYSSQFKSPYNRGSQVLCIPRENIGAVGDRALFDISLMRGFLRIDLKVAGVKVSRDCIRVNYDEIEQLLLMECNNLLQTVLNETGSLSISRFTKTNQIAFTSMGTETINNISMLLDLYSLTKDIRITPALALKVVEAQKLVDYEDCIKPHLIEKYKNYEGNDFSGLL